MSSTVRSELAKLARMSHLALKEQEVEEVVVTLDARLAYTTRLQEILQEQGEEGIAQRPAPVNVLRDDVIVASQPEPLLALAPEREENYFVVPVIIKQK